MIVLEHRRYYCSAMALNYQAFPDRVHRYPVGVVVYAALTSLCCGLSASNLTTPTLDCLQFGAFARIGVALDSATPCRYFYAAEGIGLTSIMQRRAYSDLGS